MARAFRSKTFCLVYLIVSSNFVSFVSIADIFISQLPNKDDAIIWRGPKKNGMIKSFLKDVDWGEMDFLLCDTPPGTSDEHLSINSLLNESGIQGAIIVSTPQEVALLDVRREISFCEVRYFSFRRTNSR